MSDLPSWFSGVFSNVEARRFEQTTEEIGLMAALAALTAEESWALLDFYGFKADGADRTDDHLAMILLGTAMEALRPMEREEATRLIDEMIKRKKYVVRAEHHE